MYVRKLVRTSTRAISKGIVYLIGGNKQWIHKSTDKANRKTINRTYAEYKQRELNEKGEKSGNARGRDIISLYSTRYSQVVKIRDIKKLQEDIENDPIIRAQMVNEGCL